MKTSKIKLGLNLSDYNHYLVFNLPIALSLQKLLSNIYLLRYLYLQTMSRSGHLLNLSKWSKLDGRRLVVSSVGEVS
jgi:hypothetical protein